MLGAYTWSKLISDTDTLTGWLEPGGGAGGVQNNYNIRAERSLALYDTPHRAVISYIVDLPFGKGQPLAVALRDSDKIVSRVGVSTELPRSSPEIHSLSVSPSTTAMHLAVANDRTEQASAHLDGPAQSRLNQWFNTAAFSLPAAFSFGNASRTMPDARSHGIATTTSPYSRTHASPKLWGCNSGWRSSICLIVCASIIREPRWVTRNSASSADSITIRASFSLPYGFRSDAFGTLARSLRCGSRLDAETDQFAPRRH